MKKYLQLLLAIILLPEINWGQTNPTAQTFPFSQNFFSVVWTSTTYPDGIQGWTIATSPGASFNASTPTADRTLTASSSASTTSGNVHNYNGALGFLNTSSLDLSIVIALNSTGLKNIAFNYDVMTIRNPYDGSSNTRINEVTLQYRVGTSGSFTNLTGIEYQNNTTTQTGSGVITPQNSSSKNITLPAACDNQVVVQLRWASRQVSGAGFRPSFAFDNISATGEASDPVSGVTLSGNGSGTGTISWTSPTNYNSANNEIIVFLKDGSAIAEGTASNNISGYTANASFGNGTSYQNDVSAYCVYKGDGTSVNVTNITDGHSYYALVFNTNGSSSYSSSVTNNAALPVELTTFRLSVIGKKVKLNWQTATEVNNYKFEVERRQTGNVKSETWETLGFVQGNGNSNSPKNYSFTDEPYGGKEFKYRLKQIDFDGKFEYSDEVTAVFEDVTTFELEQNYPNPFNPFTKISYTIPQRSNVKLRVYNMLAQMEAELVNEFQEAGHYQVIFNGNNLPSGTYFYKLEAGKFVEVKKFLLVK